MDDPNQGVIVLTGAKCFDLDGRVVFDVWPRDRLVQLKDVLKGRLRIVVLAEGHKCFSDLRQIDELFHDGLEGVAVYPPAFVNRIISDSLVPNIPREV